MMKMQLYNADEKYIQKQYRYHQDEQRSGYKVNLMSDLFLEQNNIKNNKKTEISSMARKFQKKYTYI